MSFLDPLFEQLDVMWVGFIKFLPMMGIALVVLLLTMVFSKVARLVLRKIFDQSDIRPSLQSLAFSLLKIGVWTLGTLVALTIIFPSLTPAKILAALGLGSIAIGFAFQDVFENFLAGVMIMLRQSMRIGDFIECEDIDGKIEQINIRDSYIRQTDGQLVLVPNSKLFKNAVFIRTDQELRRFDIVCGVAYDVDLVKAKKVIKEAVEGIDIVNKDKPVQVFASEFNSSSVDFTIRWWAKSKPIDMYESRDVVIMTVKKALDDANIEIPFPYRTLTFKERLQIQSSDAGNKEEKAA